MAAVGFVIVIFAVSAYYLSRPSALDAFDNQPVSASHLSALSSAATSSYGSGGSSIAGEFGI